MQLLTIKFAAFHYTILKLPSRNSATDKCSGPNNWKKFYRKKC